MTDKQKVERMKALHALLEDEKDVAKRAEYSAEFEKLNDELEVRNMESYQLKGKLNEIISDAEEMDSKDPKLAGLMTQYNDNVRKLFEREQAEQRRGDISPDYEVKMMPLFKGDIDELFRSYHSKDKKQSYNPPIYATASTAKAGSFRSVFGREPSKGAFADNADFYRSLLSPQFDPRIEVRMIAGSGVLGGVAVPEYLVSTIMDLALEGEIVRPRCTIYPMNELKISVPSFNSYSHTSNRTIGNWAPVWGPEATDVTAQDAQMTSMEMELKYLQLFTNCSIPLLTGASGFESVITASLAKSVGSALDSALISGSGAGQPRGLTNDPARIQVTRTSNSTVSYSDCCNMYARCWGPSLNNSVWLANPTTLPALLNLTTASGNANYVTQNPVTGKFTLLGREILFTEKLPSLGNENDLMLADLKMYSVAQWPGLILEKNSGPEWYSSQVSFRAIAGVDGQGSWSTWVTPANGNTQSWLVGLK